MNYDRMRTDEDGNLYEATDEQIREEVVAARKDSGEYLFVMQYAFVPKVFEGDDDGAFRECLEIELQGATNDMRRIVLDARRVIRQAPVS